MDLKLKKLGNVLENSEELILENLKFMFFAKPKHVLKASIWIEEIVCFTNTFCQCFLKTFQCTCLLSIVIINMIEINKQIQIIFPCGQSSSKDKNNQIISKLAGTHLFKALHTAFLDSP